MSLDSYDCVGCSPDLFVYSGNIDEDFDKTVKEFDKSIKRLDAHIKEAMFRKNHPYVYKALRFVGVY